MCGTRVAPAKAKRRIRGTRTEGTSFPGSFGHPGSKASKNQTAYSSWNRYRFLRLVPSVRTDVHLARFHSAPDRRNQRRNRSLLPDLVPHLKIPHLKIPHLKIPHLKIPHLTWFQARWFQEYAVWFLGIARNRNRPKEPDRPVEPGRFLRSWFHEYAVWLNGGT